MSAAKIISVFSQDKISRVIELLITLDGVLSNKEILGLEAEDSDFYSLAPALKEVFVKIRGYFIYIKELTNEGGQYFNPNDLIVECLKTVLENQTKPLSKNLCAKLSPTAKPLNDLISTSEENPVLIKNTTDKDFSKTTPFKLVLKDKLIKPPEHPGYLLFKEILPKFIPDAYDDNSVFKTVADNLGHSERVIFQMLTGLTSVNIIVALKLEAWLGKDVVCSKKLMALQTQYDLDAYRDKAQLKIVPFGTKTKPTGYSDEPYQTK